jgi:hypothetical protein
MRKAGTVIFTRTAYLLDSKPARGIPNRRRVPRVFASGSGRGVIHNNSTNRRPSAGDDSNKFLTYQPSMVS